MKDRAFTSNLPADAFGDSRYRYTLIVLKIHDGDTVTIEMDFGCKLKHERILRLYGIQAPELAEPDGSGIRARDHLAGLLAGLPVGMVSHRDKDDKYGRYLAELFVPSAPSASGPLKNVNAQMVRDGHAVEYFL